MTSKILFLALLITASFWLISCDKIDSPYFRDTVAGDTAGIDTVTFSTTFQATRSVLIEEFTGHKCPNCPTASVTAHDLKEANPGKVVVVSIHSGIFASPDGAGDFTYDFRTTDGTNLDGYFKIGDYGYPNGLISRKKYDPTKWATPPTIWAEKVDSLKTEPAIASIAVNAYFVNGTDIKCYIKTHFIGANNKLFKMGVILTEDSIFKPQKNNNSIVGTVPVISNYQHRGVFRQSFNGMWGTALNSSSVVDQQVFLSGYSITAGSDWVPKHCNVVVYIYDKETLEVFQVAETKVN
ncbi:MAG: Omp28-related outer membrane protein [Bacteroidota bacterium]